MERAERCLFLPDLAATKALAARVAGHLEPGSVVLIEGDLGAGKSEVARAVIHALAGKPITVYGDGRQSRCFTDVEDVVRATIALSLAPAAVGEVFNSGPVRTLRCTW